MRRVVLFDLDGTLMDTLADITEASNAILARYDRAACTVEQMRDFIGNGARCQFRRSWQGEVTEETLEEALAQYRPYYAEHLERSRPYDGIVELLRGLREEGFRCAVVTNKPQLPAAKLCERWLGDLVETVVGEEPVRAKKPAPDMVEEAMRRLGVTREECVYVGDSEVDVQTARNSAMPCYACTWGYRDVDRLAAAGAEILVDSPEELGRLLRCGEASARYLTQLKCRRSVRRFHSRAVEEEKLQTLLSAALLAPTSRGLGEVELYAVTDRAAIDALAACKAHGAEPLKTAPCALVVTAQDSRADTWVEDSALCAIILQQTAQTLGLSSCWVQMHLRADGSGVGAEENVARALGIAQGTRCVCVLALGYGAEEKLPRRAPSPDDARLHRR